MEGIRKPDTGLFEIAAKRCGTGLERGGWMVGDNLVADIRGGRTAGLRTIWIHSKRHRGEKHQADHIAADVVEAIRLIREATP
ncbi:HAD family hydrolase [Thermoactinospora rubra]|uniref:HAD family hydrolase n=1 Tax=Thermoactinospora rubra TaxID=1088767 RepID=UPI001F0AFF6F|nr:HAD hydrolase-like protein [Thermoactinospora rubra]